MRVSAANTYLSQLFRGCLKKDAAGGGGRRINTRERATCERCGGRKTDATHGARELPPSVGLARAGKKARICKRSDQWITASAVAAPCSIRMGSDMEVNFHAVHTTESTGNDHMLSIGEWFISSTSDGLGVRMYESWWSSELNSRREEPPIETTMTNIPKFVVLRDGRIDAPIITDAHTFINFTLLDLGRICESCPAGKYGIQGVCKDCPAGSYGTQAGVTSCAACPKTQTIAPNVRDVCVREIHTHTHTTCTHTHYMHTHTHTHTHKHTHT